LSRKSAKPWRFLAPQQKRPFRFNLAPNRNAALSPTAPNEPSFKYRAFLSYSHRDAAWAKWLHKALEAYRIDKDLVGRQTAHGPVPKTLRPIFRDREDFAAGHSLTEQTIAALEASEFLVVICSPNAARSEYVSDEIRRFKALGRSAQVIPLIIDGEPGDPRRECFPPALRFKVGTDGGLTREREEPIAADATQQGDGKEVAKLKVVAGLLGLPLDEVRRRAERARKRGNRIRTGIVGSVTLVLLGAALGWTAAVSLTNRFGSAQLLSMATDLAEACVHTSVQARTENVPEARRITLAVKCVAVLSARLDELSHDARVPLTFISAFEANVAILEKFKDAGKLTSQQIEILNEAKLLLAQLKERSRPLDSIGTG
jgi:hypothetical protein